MSCDPRHRRGGGDRGTVVVLVAAALGAMLMLVALVVDMGGARRDRDANQVAADATALGAVAGLTSTEESAAAACVSAWTYLVANLSSVPDGPHPCEPFAQSCVTTTPARTVVLEAGQHRVTFTHPVPDGHALMQGRVGDALDGSPCERFGVRIEQDRANLVADGSVALDVSAVGRLVPGVGRVDAPLVLLDPHACQALYLNGSAELTVSTAEGSPGHIAIDSDGKECNEREVIFRVDGKNAVVRADAISMWALADPTFTNAHQDGVDPQPVAASARVGRTGMDWRYSCDPAAGCPEEGPAHIDDLIQAWGSGTEPLPPAPGTFPPEPGEFTGWTTSGRSCSPSEAATVVPAGNWYVDCPEGLTSSGSITFEGGNIVSDGPIRASGGLRINCPADGDCSGPAAGPSILYLRSGDLRSQNDKGAIHLRETFVLLETGTVDMTGNDELRWTAPTTPGSPFEDLLLWAEGATALRLQGAANLTLEGTLFAPHAQLRLRGTSDGTALRAQVFVGTMDVGGSGAIELIPSTDRMLSLGRGQSILIR